MNASEYERFVKQNFRTIYEWCSTQMNDEPQAAVVAQKIVLDLYRTGSAGVARSSQPA